MIVDEKGKPFVDDGFAPNWLLEALMKRSPLFPSQVSKLREVVKEVTGYEPERSSGTVKFRRCA